MTTGLQEAVARLHSLPSLPLAVQAVIASFNDPDLDTGSLAQRIAQDPGLSARVLRVANSPFYGLPRKVGSIQDAIIVLGFDAVRSLVLSASMARTFPPAPGSLFDRQAYWRRSFRVAAYTHSLARCFEMGQQSAFTAGLFHDVGQLVMDLCLPQRFTELLQRQAGTGQDLIELERAELGFDHTDLGAEVIQLWNFPAEIERVVRDWRQPRQAPFEPLVWIVHAAALLEGGLNAEELVARLPGEVRERLRVVPERIRACLPDADQLDAAVRMVLGD